MAGLARDLLSRLLWVGGPSRGLADGGDPAGLLADLAVIQPREAMVLATGGQIAFLLAPDRELGLVESLLSLMARASGTDPASAARDCRVLEGEAALAQLFATAAGLEVGPQDDAGRATGSDLERVRLCGRLAEERAMIGPHLKGALDAALGAAEGLAAAGLLPDPSHSLATVALDEARRLHGDLAGCRALLVGLGDLSDVFARALREAGVSALSVCHRSQDRAQAFAARFTCHYQSWERLPDALAEADILVSDLGDGRVAITRDLLVAALKARRRRPMFLIDLGLPPDVEAAAEDLSDAFRYTLDDLERLALDGDIAVETTPQAALRYLDDARARFWAKTQLEEGGSGLEARLTAHLDALRQAVHGDLGSTGEDATLEFQRRLLAGLEDLAALFRVDDKKGRDGR